MSVSVLADPVDDRAALYCTTSGIAFGPVFDGPDAGGRAEAFLAWLREEHPGQRGSRGDARYYTAAELRGLVLDWEANYEEVVS